MLHRTFRPAALVALGFLSGCSLLVAGQTACKSSADCTDSASCVDGVCIAALDAGAGAADAGADAGLSSDAGTSPDAGASVVGFSVTGVATPAAGQVIAVTVTAQTASGQTATGYRGTVHFSSSGATRLSPALPADYAFADSDDGRHAFGVTFYEAIPQSVVVSDAADPRITGSMSFTVQAGAPAKVALSGVPASEAAGAASSATVSLLDESGNAILGFLGTVAFTSSDAKAQLPATYSFLASENGSHTFLNGVALKTAGSQTLTAHVTGTGVDLSASLPVEVSAASIDHLSVSGIGTTIPNDLAQDVTVVAQDAYGNAVAGYQGTIHFSTEDASTTLPADYTFVSADAGTHTFANEVSFSKSGTFSVTAADTAQSGIRGVEANIVVQAGAATALTVANLPSSVVAGTSHAVRVTAVDKDGNTSPGYLDTVTLTSSDLKATLTPSSHTFVAGDGGVFDFTVTFVTAGTQSVTAKDLGKRTGSQTGISVVAAAATALTVAGVPSPIASHATANVTVTAVDSYGNVDHGYRGTVHFTSTDPSAVLASNYAFTSADNGTHTFTGGVSFRTAGPRSVTATDTAHASINGKQDAISVVPGAVTSVTFSQQPADTTVGAALGTVQIRLADQDGNLATNATAAVVMSLQTSPTGATLSGTASVAPSYGLATFTGLSVDRAGPYTLKATESGASGVSSTFNAACATGYSGADCKSCANGYKPSTVTSGACVLVCSETNPCTSPPADTCSNGTTLAQHSSPGTCSPSGSAPYYSCAYPPTQVDCTTSVANGICFTDSVSHCIANPCFGVTCTNQTPDCAADGVTLDTYVASCASKGAGTYVCNQAKTSTPCTGQVCYLKACAAASVPNPGDLVVSEVMASPASDTVSKRWFEVTNISSNLLNLAGLSVDDGAAGAGHSFSLPESPPLPAPAGGRYVIGEVAASYVNAALIPSAFVMSAAGGTIRLSEGTTTVAALTWDNTFPGAAGAAMNLSAKFVNPLSMLRSFHWCSATTAMSDSGGDLGTPGGANIDCSQPGTTILSTTQGVADCKTLGLGGAPVTAGAAAGPVLGQVDEPGATDLSLLANDYYPFLEGQIGYGAPSSDASTWTWASAAWDTSYSPALSTSYDQLTASLVFPLAGQYAYGYRFRLTDSQGNKGNWAYCDSNGLVSATPPVSTNFPVVTVSP